MEYEIGQVQGDQLAARECYLAMLVINKHVQMMNIKERRVIAEPTEVLEDSPLEEGNPEKFTKLEQVWRRRRSKTSSNS